ncbi:hypothetical protein ACFYPN_28455 [Streptomyces sp. NPDC005576]|uniref:hypothetical protein n=1 Tax=Streptomyces sp. NPDC005576 TaxID=3364726 RepID=UPI0036795FBC
MRVTRALAVTATAFAAVGLAPSLAAAGGGPTPSVPVNVTVNPRAVHQGATLQISAQGCNRGGRVWSNAFPTVELSAGRTGYATARIRYDTTPGHYNLSVRCNNSNNSNNSGSGSGNGNGNNSGNGNNNGGGNNNDGNGFGNGSNNGNDAVATARFTVLDGRGAQGGLGGSMGPGSTETRIGGALVAAAAVGGAVFVVRRRRTSNAAV